MFYCPTVTQLSVKPPNEPLPKMLLEVLHGVKQKVIGGWETAFLPLAASTSVFRRTSGITTVGGEEKTLIGSALLRVTRFVSSIIAFRVNCKKWLIQDTAG